MRVILLSLAASAALFSAAAQAELTPEQDAEMRCVYDALTEDQRLTAEVMMMGEEEEATEAEMQIGPVFDVAVAGCAARYGWLNLRGDAGENYALTRIMLETMYLSLPEGVSPDTLDKVLAGFSAEDAHKFSYEGQEEMRAQGETAENKAWVARVESRLAEAGVAQENVVPSVLYFSALADFAYASQDWAALFEQQAR